MKKILILLTSVLLILSTNANAKMFNKFRKGFYFEKYKTAQKAKDALLKLHPIGSNAEALMGTLERAGAGVEKRNMDNYKKFYPNEYNKLIKDGNVKFLNFKYSKASLFFVVINKIEWSGDIWIDRNDKVKSIYLKKTRAY